MIKNRSFKNWIKNIKDNLRVFINHRNCLVRFIRASKMTLPRYGGDLDNKLRHTILFCLPIIAFSLVVVIKFCYNRISQFSNIGFGFGLGLSIIILILLLLELILFRPKIFVILLLPLKKARKQLQCEYSISMESFFSGIPIQDWKTFYRTKYEASQLLKKDFLSNDKLQLICFVNIFFRVLILLFWYSVVIMFADNFTGGEILCHLPCHLSKCTTSPPVHYLYQSFSLFLSVSSINILTSTIGGLLILLGQIIIYFSILIVVISRITDSLSMYSKQIENIAHQSIIENLKLECPGGVN